MTTSRSRFRVERCAAHGIAVGLCESPGCKGSDKARGTGRQLVGKLKPPRCHFCKRERGDAIKRGEFYGAKGSHGGYQSSWCDDCWARKEAREKEAAAAPPRVSHRNRAAEKEAYLKRQEFDEMMAGD